ncbi:ABC transporter permease [Roseisalinus antarcticus]|uniref:Branched-chain amino acid transport system / permease component n=1 Tax=Roseisalinus antarcticus TaxID=254357 RepID=A0A1Y5SF27_9RHOB|nr:ABC transporter permease [Roseisalinus antarcticus]SLN38118.1 Branched-chain amino acid transport system / permease component [Roseisalinus antarcticus]
MDLGTFSPVLLIASLMVAATPILLASIGELVAERAGVLNLGVEGMMITGAVCGFILAVEIGNPWVGFLGAALGGALLSLLFALLTQILLSNQVATGLALTLFGLGLSALLGQGYIGVRAPSLPRVDLGPLSDLPYVGRIVFGQDLMVYISLALVAAVWAVLKYTRAGLILRAVGENHAAAHALGYNVVAVRTAAIAFGGACAGLGGGYLSLVRVPQWTEGMTAGAGWIALAIVVFASWRPWRLLLGAYLFGGITGLQLNIQAGGLSLLNILPAILISVGIVTLLVQLFRHLRGGPVARRTMITGQLLVAAGIVLAGLNRLFPDMRIDQAFWLSASPYLVTILVLVVMSAGRAPGSLGKTFHAST